MKRIGVLTLDRKGQHAQPDYRVKVEGVSLRFIPLCQQSRETTARIELTIIIIFIH